MAKKQKQRRIRIDRIIFLALLLFLFTWLLGIFIKVIIKPQLEPEIVVVTPEPYVDPVRKHNYDFGKFENAPYLTYEDDTYTSDLGIDVSVHQDYIDWYAVKESGVSFAIIRAGYRGYESGLLNEDEDLRYNLEGSIQAGIETGVYFFSQAISQEEAREEARYTVELIRPYMHQGMIAFDMEYATDHDRIKDLTKEEITAITKAFVLEVKRLGYKPVVYGSASWLMDNLYMDNLQDDCIFWVASFHTEREPFPYEYSIWQYSNTGTINGIPTTVDLNIRLKRKG